MRAVIVTDPMACQSGEHMQLLCPGLSCASILLIAGDAAQRPRAQLPGGSGNASPILAHLGGQVTLQLSACQPGQLQRVVGQPYNRRTDLPCRSSQWFHGLAVQCGLSGLCFSDSIPPSLEFLTNSFHHPVIDRPWHCTDKCHNKPLPQTRDAHDLRCSQCS